jgi:CRP/FNR family cyclic AMP-dependent transcriptional regulator
MTGFEPQAVRQDWNSATDSDWAEVLAGLPLFSRIGKRKLRKLVRQAQLAEFAPGETVVATGAPADSFYVILGGEAKAFAKPAARTLRAGDYFGEMALVDDGPRSASVVATAELHVLRIPRRVFLELLEQDSAIAYTMLSELGARVRRLERHSAASVT